MPIQMKTMPVCDRDAQTHIRSNGDVLASGEQACACCRLVGLKASRCLSNRTPRRQAFPRQRLPTTVKLEVLPLPWEMLKLGARAGAARGAASACGAGAPPLLLPAVPVNISKRFGMASALSHEFTLFRTCTRRVESESEGLVGAC
jgi:hypothetical protein